MNTERATFPGGSLILLIEINAMKYHKEIKKLRSPIIVTCEHAAGLIPSEYSNLGLSPRNLQHAKDLFDPGSLELALGLANELEANLLYTEFSRLLIDANRFLGARTNRDDTYYAATLKTEVLVEDKMGERLIPIPGNQVTDYKKEERYRWNKYVKPYYQAIEKLTRQLMEKFDRIYIFQIHSFYPKYKGDIRRVDIDVIHDRLSLAEELIRCIRSKTKLYIGNNEPWGMEAVSGGLLGPLGGLRGVSVIGLDVNNKHLKRQEMVTQIQNTLAEVIKSVAT